MKSIIITLALLVILVALTILSVYYFPVGHKLYWIGFIPAIGAVCCILNVMKISDDYEKKDN